MSMLNRYLINSFHHETELILEKCSWFAVKTFFYNISDLKMEELITKMEEFDNLQIVIKRWCMENSIEQPKIMSYSLERVSKLYDNYL